MLKLTLTMNNSKQISLRDSLQEQSLMFVIFGFCFLLPGIGALIIPFFLSPDQLSNILISIGEEHIFQKTIYHYIIGFIGFSAQVALTPIILRFIVIGLGVFLIYCGIKYRKKASETKSTAVISTKFMLVSQHKNFRSWFIYILKGVLIAILLMIVWFGLLIYFIDKV